MADRVIETAETVDLRLAAAYHWVFVPAQAADDPTGPVRWDVVRVAGSDALAARVSRKLVAEESLIPAYSGTRLRLDIDRVPLWRGDHVEVNQLWADFSQYLYLPRLVRREVLEQAIEDGTASLAWTTDTFAYADTYNEERYGGLVTHSRPAAIAPSGLVVRPDVAQAQLATMLPSSAEPIEASPPPSGAMREPGGSPVGAALGEPTRFYGRISLDSTRWTRHVADIAEAVVEQLGKAPDATVRITIEIDATATGFPDGVRRTVTENAAVLKFDDSEFET